MFSQSFRHLPQRAGSLLDRSPQPDGSVSAISSHGRDVDLAADRHQLWQLLDGTRDVTALAKTLGWAPDQVWAGLDALADEGLVMRRAAPPAGGLVMSRRRLLRGSLPVVALAVPAMAAAQSGPAEQVGKAIDNTTEQSGKFSEQVAKSQNTESTSKSASEQSVKNVGESIGKGQSTESSQKANNSFEQLSKAVQEGSGKATQEGSGKAAQEQAFKAGSGTNTVPEPSTLALLGIAGAAAYISRRMRVRAADAADAAPRADQEP